MAMLVSTRASSLATQRPRASVRSRRAVVVKAFSVQDAFDWVGKGFTKIFSPPSSSVDNTMSNAQWAQNDYAGKIDHSGRRPFKDGWSSAQGASSSEASTTEAAAPEEGYLDGAVKRLVNNNFKGDSTEPEWGAGTGWKGDIHKGAGNRDQRDGFHTKKL